MGLFGFGHNDDDANKPAEGAVQGAQSDAQNPTPQSMTGDTTGQNLGGAPQGESPQPFGGTTQDSPQLPGEVADAAEDASPAAGSEPQPGMPVVPTPPSTPEEPVEPPVMPAPEEPAPTGTPGVPGAGSEEAPQDSEDPLKQ